ncbi:ribosomal L7Ae/L30e/S12e/Gadd45 family protein [Mycoplasmatota bacterium zrk1]
MKKKILNLLGLAMKSGNLISGEEMVIKNINKAKIVFLGTDTGPNTTKKITNKCLHNNVKLNRDFSIDEISQAIGKNNRVVCACLDEGFSKAIHKLLEEVN